MARLLPVSHFLRRLSVILGVTPKSSLKLLYFELDEFACIATCMIKATFSPSFRSSLLLPDEMGPRPFRFESRLRRVAMSGLFGLLLDRLRKCSARHLASCLIQQLLLRVLLLFHVLLNGLVGDGLHCHRLRVRYQFEVIWRRSVSILVAVVV